MAMTATMTARRDRIAAFLSATAWAGGSWAPLVPDASPRLYHRLTHPDGATAILMDAAGDAAGVVARFVRVAAHLSGLGLSAPRIIAAAPDMHLALIEDLGPTSLADLMAPGRDLAVARTAFAQTVDLLRGLAQHPVPAWAARPDRAALTDMVTLTLDRLAMPPGDQARARRILADALARHARGAPVLALRDVHAENLMWLPDRSGAARIGLLDFQDALALPAGYDLASLLDDPRRTIPADWRAAFIAQAAHLSGDDPTAFGARVNVLSVLRNLRILGIFHRLSTDAGRPGYAAFQPRVAACLRHAAADPALADLRPVVDDILRRAAPWRDRPAA